MNVSDGWKKVRLKDVAKINPRTNSIEDDPIVFFLPMTAISKSGRINCLESKKAIEVKKGFTSFKNDDVLVAKITPCFENYKGCLCEGLENGRGFGSTEFHILRAGKKITPNYLHILTR